jgi:hypothetical protein
MAMHSAPTHFILYFIYTAAWWLGHFVTIQKVAGSRLHEVNECSSFRLTFSATLDLGVHSASNTNEYQKQRNDDSAE